MKFANLAALASIAALAVSWRILLKKEKEKSRLVSCSIDWFNFAFRMLVENSQLYLSSTKETDLPMPRRESEKSKTEWNWPMERVLLASVTHLQEKLTQNVSEKTEKLANQLESGSTSKAWPLTRLLSKLSLMVMLKVYSSRVFQPLDLASVTSSRHHKQCQTVSTQWRELLIP